MGCGASKQGEDAVVTTDPPKPAEESKPADPAPAAADAAAPAAPAPEVAAADPTPAPAAPVEPVLTGPVTIPIPVSLKIDWDTRVAVDVRSFVTDGPTDSPADLLLWDAATGTSKPLASPIRLPSTIERFGIFHAGHLAAVHRHNKPDGHKPSYETVLWDLATQSELVVLGAYEAASPSGRWVLVRNEDLGELETWAPADRLCQVSRGGDWRVLQFHPAGTFIAMRDSRTREDQVWHFSEQNGSSSLLTTVARLDVDAPTDAELWLPQRFLPHASRYLWAGGSNFRLVDLFTGDATTYDASAVVAAVGSTAPTAHRIGSDGTWFALEHLDASGSPVVTLWSAKDAIVTETHRLPGRLATCVHSHPHHPTPHAPAASPRQIVPPPPPLPARASNLPPPDDSFVVQHGRTLTSLLGPSATVQWTAADVLPWEDAVLLYESQDHAADLSGDAAAPALRHQLLFADAAATSLVLVDGAAGTVSWTRDACLAAGDVAAPPDPEKEVRVLDHGRRVLIGSQTIRALNLENGELTGPDASKGAPKVFLDGTTVLELDGEAFKVHPNCLG
ncbi:hypothetical protein HDU96_007632 [Phlyctochytrium bullatum]|nr:hypothetical protein HDU96_007632 [Phlyctochytrium bullatum]